MPEALATHRHAEAQFGQSSATHAERCTFCAYLAAGVPRPTEAPLLESRNFVAWPSLGALVPGWTLVVTKKHRLALANTLAEEEVEYRRVASRVRRCLERQLGATVAFEHGPAEATSAVGCGVDHAHMHFVPIGIDLLRAAKLARPDLIWERVEDFNAARSAVSCGLSYLLFEDAAQRRWLARGHEIPSQFFRRLIAAGIGRDEQFDWRSYPEHHNIQKTIKLFPGAVARAA